MGIEIKLDQAFEVISKIKIPYLTIFLAFISSFMLWFLCIYFFHPNFILRHGLIITLVTAFSLTIPWLLIAMLYVPKEMTWYLLKNWGTLSNNFDFLETQRAVINLYIFANVILIHGFFMYMTFIFHFSLFTLISMLFWSAIVLYFLIDWALKRDYEKINLKKQ